MGRITVYQFKIYDRLRGEWIPARRWGTLAAILKLNSAAILRETAIRIDARHLTSDFDGFTPPDFTPVLDLTCRVEPLT